MCAQTGRQAGGKTDGRADGRTIAPPRHETVVLSEMTMEGGGGGFTTTTAVVVDVVVVVPSCKANLLPIQHLKVPHTSFRIGALNS